MAEKLAITIYPSAVGAPDLTVRDAMQQVLDFIELLEAAEGASESDVRVIWLLKSASTNSPFTVEAESTSSDPDVPTDVRAVAAEMKVADAVNSMMFLREPPQWMDIGALKICKRFFERNLNGVGRTEIKLPRSKVINVTPKYAEAAIISTEKALISARIGRENLTRTEYGTIEAIIVAASTYYGRPSLVLRDWLSGQKITCVLSDVAARQIGPEHSLKEVWEGQRIAVSGALNFNRSGTLEKIDADYIERIKTEEVNLSDIRAIDITGGMQPLEFLRLVRGEDNG